MIKKGINLIFALFLISNVSASMSDYFMDTNSIILIIIMLVSFYIINFALNRSMRDTNPAIKIFLSLATSLFIVWKFNSLDIETSNILFNLGLYNFFESYGPGVILLGFLIAMFKWGFCGVVSITGAILVFVGYLGGETGVLYNGWVLTLAGIVMLLLGLLCIYKSYKKKVSQFMGAMKKQNLKLCGFMALLGLIITITGILINQLPLSGLGIVIWILAEICPGKKKYKYGDSSPWEPDANKKQNKKKFRLWGSLQRKYNEYSKRIQIIMSRNNKRIPARGTADGEEYSRLIRGMKRLEKIARIRGIRLN